MSARSTSTRKAGNTDRPRTKARGWSYDKNGRPYIVGECSLVEFAEYIRAYARWNKETNGGKNPKTGNKGHPGSGFGGLIEDNFKK